MMNVMRSHKDRSSLKEKETEDSESEDPLDGIVIAVTISLLMLFVLFMGFIYIFNEVKRWS